MKVLILFLIGIFAVLQYELWFAKGGVESTYGLQDEIHKQLEVNKKIQDKNEVLIADIQGLRNGDNAVEEHARNDLGMIKKGEIFYQVSSDN